MSQYASAIALAQRLIEKKGRDIELRLESKFTPDPDKPWEVENARSEKQIVKAVEVDIERKFVDGTNILISDKQLIVAAASVDGKITTDHLLIDQGYNFRIVKLMPLQPGSECVMFTLIVR